MEIQAAAFSLVIGRLRARGRRIAIAAGAGWLLAGAALFLCCEALALGWWGGEAHRALGWCLLCAGIAGLAAGTLVVPLVGISRPDAVARRIGRIFPEIASPTLSASQLAPASRRGRFSPALVARHIENVVADLSQRPLERVFPARTLVWPALGLVAAAAVSLACRVLAPDVIETGMRSLIGEAGIRASQTREVAGLSPVLSDLTLKLSYPEYLHRPDRVLEVTSGGLVVPVGTTVVLDARSAVEGADRGSVTLPGNRVATLEVDSSGNVRGSFVVLEGGKMFFSLGNESYSVRGPDRTIEIEQDRPPVLRLLSPSGQTDVDEDGDVALVFEAEDDHGIDRVNLVLRPSTGGEIRKTAVRVADGVRDLRGSYHWSPQSVRLDQASEVQLELEALDNDTILGPKPGRSDPLVVRIMTRYGRHEAALKGQMETLDAIVDLLGLRIETPFRNARTDEEARRRFELMRGETEDLLGRIGRLLSDLGRDPLMPRRVPDAFARIREDLSNQILHEARLHRQPVAEAERREAADRVTIKLLEEAAIRVDDLVIEQQMSRLVEGGARLEAGRTELAALLATYERTRAEPARQAVLDAIARLEEAIARLDKDVSEIRGRVGDTYLNPDAVSRIDLAASLSRLRTLVAGGNLAEAARLVADLERDVARLMAALEGGILSFRTDRFGEGERFIGGLLDRVTGIESEQIQLKRQTTALQHLYQERVAQMVRGRIEPVLGRIATRVARMREALERAALPGEADRLGRLRAVARDLEIAIGQKDVDEARQLAEDLAAMAEEWDLADSGGAPAAVRSAGDEAEVAADQLLAVYPRTVQILAERDRANARVQAAGQRHIAALTRKLKTWVESQESQARFLSHTALGALRAAESRMKNAVTDLEGLRLRQAIDNQSAALEELARLRQDLRQSGDAAPLEIRTVARHARVDIPSPEEYEVPAEFRQDILGAMRGEMPDAYREAIQRYYEALVR